MAGIRRALVAIAAALALADASIVALALPPILVEFDTTITGAAAIIGVYALVLAACIWPARSLRPGPAGLIVFAVASVGCAIAPNLWVMLAFRALQAAGAAAALLTAFEVLRAGDDHVGRRWWLGAALIGTAAGPALGGILTEFFDWRAIFVAQVPLALAAAWASMPATGAAAAGEAGLVGEAALGAAARPGDIAPGGRAWAEPAPDAAARPGDTALGEAAPGEPAALAPLAALALTAAAFTAVLFLLVIELVAGFAISPLRAALGVSVLPVAALLAAALPGPAQARALAGALLLAGGAAALAFLPAPSIAWTIVPQLLAGAGMGLALPALSPERDLHEAARTLVARHVGIVAVLAILAPVANAQLTSATDEAILQGASLVLDAQIDPLKKLELAPALLNDIDIDRPRAGLTAAVEARRGDFADNAAVYNRLGDRLDDVVVGAVLDAFRVAYLIAAALALLAAVAMLGAFRRPAILLAATAAAGCAVIYAVESRAERPPAVTLADPCNPREVAGSSGVAGAIQSRVLDQLNGSACKIGTSREELALAVFDEQRAADFQREHGVDPRSTVDIISLIVG